jgi:pimeloyl-ACP methyl ester carboxylesterase
VLTAPRQPPAHHDITVGPERSLHVRAWPGQGKPVLLVHGLMSSSRAWNDVAAALSRPCLAIDLPGFGQSSQPTRACLSAYAEDVIHVVRALELESFTLVGHSFGGAVATAVAERVPDAVARLVLCAPAGFGRVPLAEIARLPLIRPLAIGVAPYIERRPWHRTERRAAAVPSVRIRHPAVAGQLRPGLRCAIEALANSSSTNAVARMTAYGGPVDAIWGQRDGIIPPSHLARVAATLPQTEMYVCDDVGH